MSDSSENPASSFQSTRLRGRGADNFFGTWDDAIDPAAPSDRSLSFADFPPPSKAALLGRLLGRSEWTPKSPAT